MKLEGPAPAPCRPLSPCVLVSAQITPGFNSLNKDKCLSSHALAEGPKVQRGRAGWFWLKASHEVWTGTVAIHRLDRGWKAACKEVHSRGRQAGASCWAGTSVPPHGDLSGASALHLPLSLTDTPVFAESANPGESQCTQPNSSLAPWWGE